MVKWELKAHRKSLLIWSVSMVLMIYAGMIKYGGFAASGQDINELMSALPKGLMAFFGVGVFDLTSIQGFYVIFYVYFAIMAAIHAAMLGASIVAKEEYDHTADFLLSLPVKRREIITSKAVATLIQMVVFNLVTMVASITIVAMYNKGEPINGLILKLMLGMFFLQLIFMSLGFCFAALVKRPKKAASYATGVLLTAYILSVGIDINNKLDPLKYLTPFKYFDGKVLAFFGGFEAQYIILALVLFVGMMGATYYFYQKRDIHN
jgi:ABC-2 type transport system permease protein